MILQKEELFHHGVKGQKWGVKNGPPYPLKKYYRKNAAKANTVFSTLSSKEKYYLTDDENAQYYVTEDEYRLNNRVKNIYSLVTQYKGIPVSAIDVWQYKDDPYGEVSILTNSNYRGKGFGSDSVKRAKDWLNNSQSQIQYLVWNVHTNNIPSINLATKSGFKLDEISDDKQWASYVYKKK